MSNQFIIPNFHVVLVHYPLALLVVGVLIELFAPLFWRRSSFRTAGRWMILLGALSAVPTATAGLYAMASVNRTEHTPDDATWAQVREMSPVQGQAWEMLTDHALLNAVATGGLLLVVVLWLGISDVWRSRLHFPLLIALIALLGTAAIGAWHGGEMVYRYGVAVQPARATGLAAIGDLTTPTPSSKKEIEYYLPPLEIHVIFAGAAVAVAMAALGLSLRAGAQARTAAHAMPEMNNDIAAAFVAPTPRPYVPGGTPPIASGEYMPPMEAEMQRVPMARFWLLAGLLALCTAGVGVWFLARPEGMGWDLNRMWELVHTRADNGSQFTRRFCHVVVGGAIVVLPLILAMLGRVAAARRPILGLLALLLIAAVAAQVWLGALLLMDSPAGPITSFNPPPKAAGVGVPISSSKLPTTAPTTEPATP